MALNDAANVFVSKVRGLGVAIDKALAKVGVPDGETLDASLAEEALTAAGDMLDALVAKIEERLGLRPPATEDGEKAEAEPSGAEAQTAADTTVATADAAPADPRDAEIAKLKAELEAKGSDTAPTQ